MDVHLVDGTYELFRHYYALPSVRDANGRLREMAGMVPSMRNLLDKSSVAQSLDGMAV